MPLTRLNFFSVHRNTCSKLLQAWQRSDVTSASLTFFDYLPIGYRLRLAGNDRYPIFSIVYDARPDLESFG